MGTRVVASWRLHLVRFREIFFSFSSWLRNVISIIGSFFVSGCSRVQLLSNILCVQKDILLLSAFSTAESLANLYAKHHLTFSLLLLFSLFVDGQQRSRYPW